MISLILPVVFFCILVLIYPIASMTLSISAWIWKQWEGKHDIKGKITAEMIDNKTDEIKDVMFNVLVYLIFFLVSPFAVFYLLR